MTETSRAFQRRSLFAVAAAAALLLSGRGFCAPAESSSPDQAIKTLPMHESEAAAA